MKTPHNKGLKKFQLRIVCMAYTGLGSVYAKDKRQALAKGRKKYPDFTVYNW